MNHKKGYATTAEAACSKAYLTNPNAFLNEGCLCGLVHVEVAKATPSPRKVSRHDTGFPAAVKLAARKRAGDGAIEEARCESCGRWLGRYSGEIQHRLARGFGGDKNPVTSSVCNAVLLCGSSVTPGSCHRAAEQRDEEMRVRGFWIRRGNGPGSDPRHVPIQLGSDPEVLVWLNETGTYSLTPPAEVAALCGRQSDTSPSPGWPWAPWPGCPCGSSARNAGRSGSARSSRRTTG